MRFTPRNRQTRPRTDAYTRDSRHDRRDRRDASSGWREEYASQATPLPDGGVPDATDSVADLPDPGDRVRDRDTAPDDGEELIVLAVAPDTPAAQRQLEALDGATVADVNPDYPADSPVVEAVYVEAAARSVPEWATVADLRQAVDADRLTCYSFPAARVAPHDPARDALGGETRG